MFGGRVLCDAVGGFGEVREIDGRRRCKGSQTRKPSEDSSAPSEGPQAQHVCSTALQMTPQAVDER
eukprot:2413865-Prymnesium_polylepis.1